MKKIILIYGEDKASKLAIKELNSLRFEYQNLISKNNIQILMIQDNQLDEQHKFESLPSIRFINDEELLNIEGYNIENLNNYEEYFWDFLKLRKPKPFDSWIWNRNKQEWKAPIENLNEKPDLFSWDEETQTWVSKTNYARYIYFNPSIKEDMENIINEN